MDTQEILEKARKLRAIGSRKSGITFLGEAMELIRYYGTEQSVAYKHLEGLTPTGSEKYLHDYTGSILDGFIETVENGLLAGVSIERQAQIDVVSDFLGQAHQLLETSGVHPAAPCVIIGAALEEFLRNWVEEQNIPIGNQKPGIDAYAKALKSAGLITKQDIKDITSWGGRRNHAAHGEWEEVGDKKMVSSMLEGVNLFMRKYGLN